MLGYVAAHSETLAMAVIMSKGKAHILYRNHTVFKPEFIKTEYL